MSATAPTATTAHCKLRSRASEVARPLRPLSFGVPPLRVLRHRCEICTSGYFEDGECNACPDLSFTIAIAVTIFLTVFIVAFVVVLLGRAPDKYMSAATAMGKSLTRQMSRRLPRKMSMWLNVAEVAVRSSERCSRMSKRVSTARASRMSIQEVRRSRKSEQEMSVQRRSSRSSSCSAASNQAMPPPKEPSQLQIWSQLALWRLRRMAFIPKLKV